MIVAEDLTEDSCADGLPPEEREAVARFCGGGFSTGDEEDVARNWGHLHDKEPELAESVSVNETPDMVPHWANSVAQELVGCSSCSSSSSRCQAVEAGREELVSSIYSGVE